ncbi:MAG: hypothetical protein IKM24_02230, partial [Clostridia bacterium]|nr:hypothetical protein [Clostridia bacterium]
MNSKTVSFSLVFLIKYKNDLLVVGNTGLQGGLCFVECVDIYKNKIIFLYYYTLIINPQRKFLYQLAAIAFFYSH